MKIIRDLTDYHDKTPLALSLGMFDGVHLGHLSIINTLNKIAKKEHLESAILSFWPHPRKFLNPDDDVKMLNTLEEKLELLEKSGIQNIFLKTFDEEFRNLSGADFCEKILVEKLNVKHIIIGYDHTFGKNKSGDFNLLKALSGDLGFKVDQLEAVKSNQLNISSTKIRQALSEGKIKEANQMLGYHYPLTGKVIHGKKLGRTIGYPTANIEVPVNKLLPKNGAYIVEVFVDQQFYKGMLSIGTNPTIDDKNQSLHTEVYILDFDQDIYGKEITVKFRDFLHDEIKFDGMERLIEKLDEDKRLTESYDF
ncbi:bifunctional riboflavin kinase/FAD synthetase [Epilithonimonas vandammei]|uniref:Riboflavin biosynthesis protein n=1 Tax=Epilithonimonas vandammei TaxID=2487072 RepID=A0A3G8Y4E1_9FLAO|nr:bifunctional riboflavin kinase/FAD synthetase [Epilithonimonas vandammei]AZI40235.1 bifunctional riboflavin kinase/FAD synthetase [Epilithonimonas vandammei]AZI55090.1 bifunctional riboflavin kinase/FAD synthetase [Epilithonimonas vandammei]